MTISVCKELKQMRAITCFWWVQVTLHPMEVRSREKGKAREEIQGVYIPWLKLVTHNTRRARRAIMVISVQWCRQLPLCEICPPFYTHASRTYSTGSRKQTWVSAAHRAWSCLRMQTIKFTNKVPNSKVHLRWMPCFTRVSYITPQSLVSQEGGKVDGKFSFAIAPIHRCHRNGKRWNGKIG